MKLLLFTFCILTLACTNNSRTSKKSTSQLDSIFSAEGFDTSIAYANPICLQYRGKPLLTIGQDVKALDTAFSFRYDPNGKYQDHWPSVTDYLSLEDFYSANLSTGSINGALFFSADQRGKIFRIEGSWSIEGELVDTFGVELMNYLYAKYFPCLPPDFKGRRYFELAHDNFIETFRLSTDGIHKGNRFGRNWLLDYSVTLKKKNGL